MSAQAFASTRQMRERWAANERRMSARSVSALNREPCTMNRNALEVARTEWTAHPPRCPQAGAPTRRTRDAAQAGGARTRPPGKGRGALLRRSPARPPSWQLVEQRRVARPREGRCSNRRSSESPCGTMGGASRCGGPLLITGFSGTILLGSVTVLVQTCLVQLTDAGTTRS